MGNASLLWNLHLRGLPRIAQSRELPNERKSATIEVFLHGMVMYGMSKAESPLQAEVVVSRGKVLPESVTTSTVGDPHHSSTPSLKCPVQEGGQCTPPRQRRRLTSCEL